MRGEKPERNEWQENISRHASNLLDILGIDIENLSLRTLMGSSVPLPDKPRDTNGETGKSETPEVPRVEGKGKE